MAVLNNPFVIYGYKGAECFCDRFFALFVDCLSFSAFCQK